MGRRPTSIVAIVLCGLALMWGASSPISLAQHATPEAAAPVGHHQRGPRPRRAGHRRKS